MARTAGKFVVSVGVSSARGMRFATHARFDTEKEARREATRVAKKYNYVRLSGLGSGLREWRNGECDDARARQRIPCASCRVRPRMGGTLCRVCRREELDREVDAALAAAERRGRQRVPVRVPQAPSKGTARLRVPGRGEVEFDIVFNGT